MRRQADEVLEFEERIVRQAGQGVGEGGREGFGAAQLERQESVFIDAGAGREGELEQSVCVSKGKRWIEHKDSVRLQ